MRQCLQVQPDFTAKFTHPFILQTTFNCPGLGQRKGFERRADHSEYGSSVRHRGVAAIYLVKILCSLRKTEAASEFCNEFAVFIMAGTYGFVSYFRNKLVDMDRADAIAARVVGGVSYRW